MFKSAFAFMRSLYSSSALFARSIFANILSVFCCSRSLTLDGACIAQYHLPPSNNLPL